MAPENELLSSWREELRQQASQGSGREELEGGGEEQEGEIEMLDKNGNVMMQGMQNPLLKAVLSSRYP